VGLLQKWLLRALSLGFAVVNLGPFLNAQASPTASRAGDLQIGASFNLASPDYRNTRALKGFGFYGTFDFKSHFGVDAEFHQLNDPDSKEGVYERSYEIGPRYVLHFGPLAPYAKFMVGRGVFNFPPAPDAPNGGPAANLAFNMWAGGFGVDYSIRPSINIRGDYELQQWSGFPPNGLSPKVFSIGVAYRFH
jgi:hypothetical protein